MAIGHMAHIRSVDHGSDVAVGQNSFWGAPPILVDFSGDLDVYWGYELGFDPWPCFNKRAGFSWTHLDIPQESRRHLAGDAAPGSAPENRREPEDLQFATI